MERSDGFVIEDDKGVTISKGGGIIEVFPTEAIAMERIEEMCKDTKGTGVFATKPCSLTIY
jgi:hypothetical protein